MKWQSVLPRLNCCMEWPVMQTAHGRLSKHDPFLQSAVQAAILPSTGTKRQDVSLLYEIVPRASLPKSKNPR